MPSRWEGATPERGKLSLVVIAAAASAKCTDDGTLASLPAKPSACEQLSNPVYCCFQLAPKAVVELHFANAELFTFRLRQKFGKLEPVQFVGGSRR
jgi:hypothetical protein